MADNNYNIIKPVESLQNIRGLTPAKRRKEGKKQQDLHKRKEKEPEQEANEANEANEAVKNDEDQHSIDYCA